MIEREVKFKLKSPSLEEIEKRLNQNSIEFMGKEDQEDIYFKYDYRDFKETDEAIRLRKTETGYELTYKGPKRGKYGKSREEITVKISKDDVSNIKAIMDKLGLHEAFRVKKVRKNFKLDNFILSLDRVENLGDFIELEGMDVSEEELRRKFEKLIIDFNIVGEMTNTSYLELLLMRNDKVKQHSNPQ